MHMRGEKGSGSNKKKQSPKARGRQGGQDEPSSQATEVGKEA